MISELQPGAGARDRRQSLHNGSLLQYPKIQNMAAEDCKKRLWKLGVNFEHARKAFCYCFQQRGPQNMAPTSARNVPCGRKVFWHARKTGIMSSLLCFNSEDVQNCLTTARNVPCGRARGMLAMASMYALAIVFQRRGCPELSDDCKERSLRTGPGHARNCSHVCPRYCVSTARLSRIVLTTARNVPCGRARGMLAIARMYALAIVFQQRGCPELSHDCKERSLRTGPGHARNGFHVCPRYCVSTARMSRIV